MLQIQNNPWLGLASYQEKDADLFFGREKEIALLCDVIKQNYSTIIYGKSGMGKTSLINAGLIPLLSKDGFLPVSIKLEHNSSRSYTQQIIETVTQKLKEQECEIENDAQLDSMLPDECRLWAFFHTNIFWSKDNHRIIPVVFIDQFEEIFTICESKTEVLRFFSMLNDLFQPLPPDEVLKLIENKNIRRIDFNETTNFRLILSLREDFLARLEDYSYNIPVLKKNRVGVSPMNGLQALEVILKPIPDIMDRTAALKIVEKVSKCPHVEDDEEVLKDISIETCILSLFCSQLYKKAVELKRNTITSELIEQFGDNIINDYYHECMRKVSKDSVMYLEDKLLTSSGYRNSLAYEDVVPKYVQKSEIEHLEKCRLIRIEILNKTERIEFTHDVLCGVALEHKTQRHLNSERKSKLLTGIGYAIETLLLLGCLYIIFWQGKGDPFFFLNQELSFFVTTVLLLFIPMQMRFTIYTTDRRSILFSLGMFVLSCVGGGLACGLMDELRCAEEWWLFWCIVYYLYIIIVLILSFTKTRRGTLAKSLKSTFLIKEMNPMSLTALKIVVLLGYLLAVAVSAVYMREPITIVCLLGIVPVLLSVVSIGQSVTLKNKNVWLTGLAAMALLLGLYFTQFVRLRFLTYLVAVLLLLPAYLGVSSAVAFKQQWVKATTAVAVWVVCFILLPTVVVGYNFWGLGSYVFVKDGLIVSLYDKLQNRYVVLANEDGKQGAFTRDLQTLIPARFNYMGSEAKYRYKRLDSLDVSDVRFRINRFDSVFVSDYLAYENRFSRPLLSSYTYLSGKTVHDFIKETIATVASASDDGSTTLSQSGKFVHTQLDNLYDDGVLMEVLNPELYMKMARYYHVKDSIGQETAMLSKLLQYSMAVDSTARFLSKGNWKSNKTESVSSLVGAVMFIDTGHLYSNYVAKYDSCFLSDSRYQQYVREVMADAEPQAFLSEVIDSGLYDFDVLNTVQSHMEMLSFRNPDINSYIEQAYLRQDNLTNLSFAYIFMGKYAEAKQAAQEALDTAGDVIASTNLLSGHLFSGEYEEVYKLLEHYNDSVLFNGAFKFYRDWIMQDLNQFERIGITDEIPKDEYRKLRAYIDPHNDRNYGTLAKCPQYGVYWAATNPNITWWFWSFPFGLHQDGTVCLYDMHGNRLTPDFDDVHVANYGYDVFTDEWTFDPIVIYRMGRKRGFYDVPKRAYLTDAVYDHAWIFSDGLAAVAKDRRIGFIDETGKLAIPFRFYYVPDRDYVFMNGYVCVYNSQGSVGVIDKQGEIVFGRTFFESDSIPQQP